MIFNFIVPSRDENHLEQLRTADIDRDVHIFQSASLNWTLQAYLMLERNGLAVSCSNKTLPGAINIGHSQYLRTIPPKKPVFTVSITGEYRYLAWAQFHIVQNQSQIRRGTSYWMPLWPQPGLTSRNKDRKRVKCVAYAGRPNQLSDRSGRIRSKFARIGVFGSHTKRLDYWRDELVQHGLQFRFLRKPSWNDLSEVDILLGIRSFNRESYNYLPPSKLINAWHAGIPFIGGNDSAYRQVGTPGKDYIRVTGKNEMLDAIIRLRDDPVYYDSIVQAGYRKAEKYTRETIADRWIQLLSGKIVNAYGVWLASDDTLRSTRHYAGIKKEKIIRLLGRTVIARLR